MIFSDGSVEIIPVRSLFGMKQPIPWTEVTEAYRSESASDFAKSAICAATSELRGKGFSHGKGKGGVLPLPLR